MPETIENYIPQNALPQIRRRAFFVWAWFSILAAVWAFMIALAPAAAAHEFFSLSNPLYNFFGFLCHQNPARSIDLVGHPLAVCARCFGVYAGLLLGFVAYPLVRSIEEVEPLPRVWLFLAIIPVAIDWLLGVFDIWANTPVSRFLTGAILGAACAVYIVPALVEIFGFSMSKRRVKKAA